MTNFWTEEDNEVVVNDKKLTPDERYEQAFSLSNLRALYKAGKIKLNESEKEILQFCHDRDMVQFLREEFERHPIILNEDGSLKYGNPFDKERERL